MIDTVLFDLDGTLLPLDMQRFTAIYFQEMGTVFQDVIEPQTLVKHIWTATKAMVTDTEPRTNETVFMECFAKLIKGAPTPDLAVYRDLFQSFYDCNFLKTKDAAAESPAMRQSVSFLKNKGFHLVIATNPIFPLQAIEQRITWAGFQPDDFEYISCYEKNHYCKPQLQFFQEILTAIDKEPAQCLMVGNDVVEDLVAGKLGIKTFLITDYLIQPDHCPYQSDYQGTYQDFYRFVTTELIS